MPGAQRATEWLAAYRPQRIPPRDWAAVRPFVVESATRLGLDHGAAAVRVVRVLARLAAWAVGEGLPLDVEVVLDPDTVERFVAVGLADDRSRATYRAVLRRVGPLLTTTGAVGAAAGDRSPAARSPRRTRPGSSTGCGRMLLAQPTRGPGPGGSGAAGPGCRRRAGWAVGRPRRPPMT